MLLSLIALSASATLQDPVVKPVSIPTSVQSWNDMTAEQRGRYARITVEALRRSPTFERCARLDADVLEKRIASEAREGSPLMMAVAVAAYSICDEPSGS